MATGKFIKPLCALPGPLVICTKCRHRAERVPGATEPQIWFTPKRGVGSCKDYDGPGVGIETMHADGIIRSQEVR